MPTIFVERDVQLDAMHRSWIGRGRLMESNSVMPSEMMLWRREVINVPKRTFKIHLP